MGVLASARHGIGVEPGEGQRIAFGRIRWLRVWAIAAVTAAVIVALITIDRFEYAAAGLNPGIDYDVLMGATRSFLAGNGFYPAEQLAGPWIYHQGEPAFMPPILYPPDALLLFVPLSFLPGAFWWAVPIALTAWALWRLRPHPAAWLVIALLLGVPQSREGIFWGNPAMWMTALEAAGMVLGWPAVLVLLKPTLGPFALAGAWHRSWWLALAALALVNLPLLPLWVDWVTVLRNAPSQLSLGFSLYQYPLLCVPLVAWLGSRQGPIWGRLQRRTMRWQGQLVT